MQVKFDPKFDGTGGDCSHCPIRENAVCSMCGPEELSRLEVIKSYSKVPAGTVAFRAGDKMQYVASVVTGVATLSRTLEDGRRQTVGLLLPSDFIGRPGRDRYPFDVEATSDLMLCRFESKVFGDVLTSTPNVSNRLLQMTLDELDAARDWAIVLGRLTAREKVASFLLLLARRMGVPGKDGIAYHLPLTREAIADHLGLTLETTSRQFSALKRDGVILLEGRAGITIPDLAVLSEEAGEDSDGTWLT